MAADDDDLIWIFCADDFADHVGGADGAIREAILHVDVHAHGFAAVEETLEEILAFGGDAHHGNIVRLGESEDAGMGEIHALRFRAALSADDGDGADVLRLLEEETELAEAGHAVRRARSLLHGEEDFAAP